LCIADLTRGDLPAYLSFERMGESNDLLRLAALGYSGFKCISQYEFIPVEWPPAPEQRALGPFGEETPGRWQSLREFQDCLEHVDRQRQAGYASPFWNGAGYTFWADIHAKLAS
jgi:hypothetical protein